MQGTVKNFDRAKGYGFITREGASDVFFHFSSIEMDGYKSVNAGDRVEFDLETGADGRDKAIKVKKI